jgi:tRNA-specific 2-thiouridylase
MEHAPDNAAGSRLVVRLMAPLRGVAPGQTVVLYQGTRVLGQATIDAARSLQRAAL